jgi:DNA-binding helix-turn-helix protein
MKVNYKKLWHILLDRDMKKKELAQIAGVSTYTINKLNKNENVTVEVLGKICRALNCTLDDIMEFEEDEKQKQGI